MSVEKAAALVLRVVDFSESSCVVTLFTREFGKVSALAKGARRPKGPFDSALDLLCLCRVVFLRKSSSALDLLTEARLERRFRAPSHDLANLYAGYYVAEMLASLTDEYDVNEQLFDLADSTLATLQGELPVSGVVLRYELKLLDFTGHLPNLNECVGCGDAIVPAKLVPFGMLDGGLLCGTCRSRKRHVVMISQGTINTLKLFCDPSEERWRSFDLKTVNRGELRGVMNQYISHLLGKKPRMASFLGFLTK